MLYKNEQNSFNFWAREGGRGGGGDHYNYQMYPGVMSFR